MARSLNKVQLIGNLTRDPELRYTPSGAAVCTFGIATNRQWNTDTGEKREDVEFHRIVAWQKLAELCAQLLSKGRKVFVEGRLQTRKWQAQDGTDRVTTEIVISDMIILDSRGAVDTSGDFDVPDDAADTETPPDEGEQASPAKSAKTDDKKTDGKSTAKKSKSPKKDDKVEDDDSDDIPF